MTTIHGMNPRWDWNDSLCGDGNDWDHWEDTALPWEEGHGGVPFPAQRTAINCLRCAAEVARRVDGTSLDRLSDSRAVRALRRDGVYTIEYVEAMSDRKLLEVPNIGRKSSAELRVAISEWRTEHPLLAAPSTPSPLSPWFEFVG